MSDKDLWLAGVCFSICGDAAVLLVNSRKGHRSRFANLVSFIALADLISNCPYIGQYPSAVTDNVQCAMQNCGNVYWLLSVFAWTCALAYSVRRHFSWSYQSRKAFQPGSTRKHKLLGVVPRGQLMSKHFLCWGLPLLSVPYLLWEQHWMQPRFFEDNDPSGTRKSGHCLWYSKPVLLTFVLVDLAVVCYSAYVYVYVKLFIRNSMRLLKPLSEGLLDPKSEADMDKKRKSVLGSQKRVAACVLVFVLSQMPWIAVNLIVILVDWQEGGDGVQPWYPSWTFWVVNATAPWHGFMHAVAWLLFDRRLHCRTAHMFTTSNQSDHPGEEEIASSDTLPDYTAMPDD